MLTKLLNLICLVYIVTLKKLCSEQMMINGYKIMFLTKLWTRLDEAMK